MAYRWYISIQGLVGNISYMHRFLEHCECMIVDGPVTKWARSVKTSPGPFLWLGKLLKFVHLPVMLSTFSWPVASAKYCVYYIIMVDSARISRHGRLHQIRWTTSYLFSRKSVPTALISIYGYQQMVIKANIYVYCPITRIIKLLCNEFMESQLVHSFGCGKS